MPRWLEGQGRRDRSGSLDADGLVCEIVGRPGAGLIGVAHVGAEPGPRDDHPEIAERGLRDAAAPGDPRIVGPAVVDRGELEALQRPMRRSLQCSPGPLVVVAARPGVVPVGIDDVDRLRDALVEIELPGHGHVIDQITRRSEHNLDSLNLKKHFFRPPSFLYLFVIVVCNLGKMNFRNQAEFTMRFKMAQF